MHRRAVIAGRVRPLSSRCESLQPRLEGAFAEVDRKCVVLGVSDAGRHVFASVGAGPLPAERPFRTGCATKLLVAALIEKRLEQLGAGFDVPARRLLRVPLAGARLGDVTARHLLEHTHGLHDADIEVAEPQRPLLRADGRQNLEPLLADGGERFAEPGRWYSYSSFGARVLAAILEELDGRQFAELLDEQLLEPLGMARRTAAADAPVGAETAGSPTAICPATGGALALGVRDLLIFLDSWCADVDAPAGSHRHDSEPVKPLPGWHPFELGIRLGWKCYSGGAFGHQSIWPGASLWLRSWPRSRSSLVVASAYHPAAVVSATVLGASWPELQGRPFPRLLAARDAERLELGRYCGRYAGAGAPLEVEQHRGRLVLSSGSFRTALLPARDDVFFLTEPAGGRSFVQFLARPGLGVGGLWDGQRVFGLIKRLTKNIV